MQYWVFGDGEGVFGRYRKHLINKVPVSSNESMRYVLWTDLVGQAAQSHFRSRLQEVHASGCHHPGHRDIASALQGDCALHLRSIGLLVD